MRQKVVRIVRLPKLRVYDTTSDMEQIHLDALDVPKPWYNLDNKKDKDKYIKTVERMVRSSMEYHALIDYLKTKMGMNFCSFFHRVSRDIYSRTKLSIEIHHEPFTLYDIVAIVLNDTLNRYPDNYRPDMFDIASEVMEMHYKGYVGLIPLSKTVHELVHSGKLFIPLQFIDGGFNMFLHEYKDTIQSMDGLMEMLAAKINLSKEYEQDPDRFVSILKKKYIYVVNEGYDNIPDIIEK
jgi:hypothetical protein